MALFFRSTYKTGEEGDSEPVLESISVEDGDVCFRNRCVVTMIDRKMVNHLK